MKNLNQEGWNEVLKNEGLAPITEPEIIEVATLTHSEGTSDNYEQDLIREAMGEVFEKFSVLPEKIKEDIISDIIINRDSGMNYTSITKRLNQLIEQGQKLDKLTTADSDKIYKPIKKPEELKLENETKEIVVDDIDDLIKKLEEMRYKKDAGDEPSSQTNEPKKNWVN